MDELTRGRGTDGREYIVTPVSWTLKKVEECWGHITNFHIFSDDVDKSVEGFLNFVLGSGALWFEIVDAETSEAIGLMYLTDVKKSYTGSMTEACWHSMVWDAKAGPRRPIAQDAVRAIFRTFGFHRLRAEIPMHFGGVIRQAKKLGFKEEGRLREAKQYNGIWYDALILSILAKEVEA